MSAGATAGRTGSDGGVNSGRESDPGRAVGVAVGAAFVSRGEAGAVARVAGLVAHPAASATTNKLASDPCMTATSWLPGSCKGDARRSRGRATRVPWHAGPRGRRGIGTPGVHRSAPAKSLGTHKVAGEAAKIAYATRRGPGELVIGSVNASENLLMVSIGVEPEGPSRRLSAIPTASCTIWLRAHANELLGQAQARELPNASPRTIRRRSTTLTDPPRASRPCFHELGVTEDRGEERAEQMETCGNPPAPITGSLGLSARASRHTLCEGAERHAGRNELRTREADGRVPGIRRQLPRHRPHQ